MGSLKNRQNQTVVKLLNMGDSGKGKTSALISLAEAGYNLRIADFDNGIDILSDLCQYSKDPDGVAGRVNYLTFTDKMKPTKGGVIIPAGMPTAYSRFVKALSNWKDDEEDFGSVTNWTPEDVLVIDSLTFLSRAVMRWHLFNVGRIDSPYPKDWLVAQRKVADLLDLLYSDSVQCNIVINAHIRYVDILDSGDKFSDDKSKEPSPGEIQGYPESVGRALPPQIPRFFNTVVQTKIVGSGKNAKHRIRLVPDSLLGLKNAVPHRIKEAELPLESGLATIFRTIRGSNPIRA